jgi:hypothetical protein
MFQRILVPLDGSARAERALPVVARLVRVVSKSNPLWPGKGQPRVLMQRLVPEKVFSVFRCKPSIAHPCAAGWHGAREGRA